MLLKRTVQTSVKVAKAAIKATIETVKATLAVLKETIALVIAGGWVAVIIILVIILLGVVFGTVREYLLISTFCLQRDLKNSI